MSWYNEKHPHLNLKQLRIIHLALSHSQVLESRWGLSVLVTTFLYISHLSLCGTNERETLCHERRQRTSLSLSLLSQICVPHRTYTRMLAVPLPRVKSLPFSRVPSRHDPIIHDALDRMGQRDAVWMIGSRVSIIAKTNDVALSES